MVSLRGLALWGYLRCIIEPAGHNNICCVTDLPSSKSNDYRTPIALWAATPSYWGLATSLVVARSVSVIADHLQESLLVSNHPTYVLAIWFRDSANAP